MRSTDRIADDIRVIDIARVALTDRTPARLSSESEPGTARVLTDRPGRIEIETNAPATQLLILTERFHEGWLARDESGRDVQTLPVYGDYIGCVVGAGTRIVTLTFTPASARVGLWLTLAGLVLTAISTWVVRGRL